MSGSRSSPGSPFPLFPYYDLLRMVSGSKHFPLFPALDRPVDLMRRAFSVSTCTARAKIRNIKDLEAKLADVILPLKEIVAVAAGEWMERIAKSHGTS